MCIIQHPLAHIQDKQCSRMNVWACSSLYAADIRYLSQPERTGPESEIIPPVPSVIQTNVPSDPSCPLLASQKQSPALLEGGVFPPPAGNPLWLSSQAEDTLDSQSRERRLSPFPRDLLLAPAPAQMPILHNLSLSLPRSLSLSPSLPFSLTSCSPSRVDSLCTHLLKHRIYPLCCRWMLCHFKSLHISRPTVSEPVSPERSDENDADNDA